MKNRISIKSKTCSLIIILLLGSIVISTTIGEETLPPYHEEPNNQVNQTQQIPFYLSLSILLFGLILSLAEIAVIFKKKDVCWDPSAFRVFGLTLIIISGVFLITAGYSEYQIASMMGLLGTVAGYLLAKTE